jgi:hypothetical protein
VRKGRSTSKAAVSRQPFRSRSLWVAAAIRAGNTIHGEDPIKIGQNPATPGGRLVPGVMSQIATFRTMVFASPPVRSQNLIIHSNQQLSPEAVRG